VRIICIFWGRGIVLWIGKKGREKKEGSLYNSFLLFSDCYAAVKTVEMTGILDDVSYPRA
jgi:hypothetical protein